VYTADALSQAVVFSQCNSLLRSDTMFVCASPPHSKNGCVHIPLDSMVRAASGCCQSAAFHQADSLLRTCAAGLKLQAG
jgi:hypothetical protein